MMPLFFGPSDRALYGLYEPAAGGLSRRGVVVCPPMGAEYYQAHSVCRSLARRLAEAGVHVLRFDYLGTGDSAREIEDVQPTDWLHDVELAGQELREMANLPVVGLIGIRAGATVARAAAQGGCDTDRIAFWDPIPTGHPGLDRPHPDGSALPGRALLVSTGQDQDVESCEAFSKSVLAACPELEVVEHHERGPWDVQAVGPGSVPMPVESFRTIVEWTGAA